MACIKASALVIFVAIVPGHSRNQERRWQFAIRDRLLVSGKKQSRQREVVEAHLRGKLSAAIGRHLDQELILDQVDFGDAVAVGKIPDCFRDPRCLALRRA